MMGDRTMKQRGFSESNMTDHEFASFTRKHDATYRQHLIGTVWTNRADDSTVAVVTYDNASCTRKIWIKEGL